MLNLILIKRFDYNTNLFRLTEIILVCSVCVISLISILKNYDDNEHIVKRARYQSYITLYYVLFF